MKYEDVKGGKWYIAPKHKGYLFACCDCGLVHQVDFRIKGKDIQFRLWRDNTATRNRRRYMKRKEQSKGGE